MKYLFRDPTLESLLSIVIVTSAVNSSLTALLGRVIIGKWFDASAPTTSQGIGKADLPKWFLLLLCHMPCNI